MPELVHETAVVKPSPLNTLPNTIPGNSGPIQSLQSLQSTPVQSSIPFLEPSDFQSRLNQFDRVVDGPKDRFVAFVDLLHDLTPAFAKHYNRSMFNSLVITICNVLNLGYMEKLQQRFKMDQETAAFLLKTMLSHSTVWKAKQARSILTNKLAKYGIKESSVATRSDNDEVVQTLRGCVPDLKEFKLEEFLDDATRSDTEADLNTLRDCLRQIPAGMNLRKVYEILKQEFPHLPL
jgi:hypothetical protein